MAHASGLVAASVLDVIFRTLVWTSKSTCGLMCETLYLLAIERYLQIDMPYV